MARMPTSRRPVFPVNRLPRRYAITGHAAHSDEWWRRLEKLLAAGLRMIQLRLPDADAASLEAAARRAALACQAVDAALILNGPAALAMELDLAGLHLRSTALLQQQARPVPEDRLLGASCHNRRELEHAGAIGVDFVCLSPVFPTASHPGAPVLGLEGFGELVAGTQLPVYALGGTGPRDLCAIRAAGGYGVAGISAFWG